MSRNEEFARGSQHLMWPDIEEQHPSYKQQNTEWDEDNPSEYRSPMNNDLYETVHHAMFSTQENPDAEHVWDEDISFRPTRVPIADLTYTQLHEDGGLVTSNPRVERAKQGTYGTGPGKIPPILVVKRGEQQLVADGNHRVNAAVQQGQTDIPAYVAESHITTPYRSWY